MKNKGLEQLLRIPFPVRLLDLDDTAYEEIPQEPIQEGFSNEMFKYIKPGKERVCVILRAEAFSPVEIAFILGITRAEVDKAMFDIKTRLGKMGVIKLVKNKEKNNKFDNLAVK